GCGHILDRWDKRGRLSHKGRSGKGGLHRQYAAGQFPALAFLQAEGNPVAGDFVARAAAAAALPPAESRHAGQCLPNPAVNVSWSAHGASCERWSPCAVEGKKFRVCRFRGTKLRVCAARARKVLALRCVPGSRAGPIILVRKKRKSGRAKSTFFQKNSKPALNTNLIDNRPACFHT